MVFYARLHYYKKFSSVVQHFPGFVWMHIAHAIVRMVCLLRDDFVCIVCFLTLCTRCEFSPVLLSARILQACTSSSLFVSWAVPFRTPPSSVGAVEAVPPWLIISPGTAIFRSYKINPRARHSVIIIITIIITIIIIIVISVGWIRSVTIIAGVWISLTVWDIIRLI